MSQKQVKRYARTIRRNRDRIIKDYVKAVKDFKFFDRVKFAWAIIKAKS